MVRLRMDELDPRNDPLQLAIQEALLSHKDDYSLREMELALSKEAQALREMAATSAEQEQNA